MTNATHSSTQHLVMIYHPECGTVDLSHIEPNDTLLINTENSLYSFQVTNNQVLRGKLSKANNDQATDAVLVGSLIQQQGQPITLRSKLQINAHALFLVLHHDQFIELATSPVVGISLVTTSVPRVEAMESAITKPIQSVA